MKIAELRSRGRRELLELQEELTAKLHKLQWRARSRSLKTVHEIKAARRTRARIFTLLAEPAKNKNV